MTEMTVGVPRRWAGWGRTRHLAGMVVAMVAGMVLLGPLWRVGGDLLGGAGVLARPDVGALVMATNMALGMVAWMWYRGDAWAATGEMSAAMYVPFLLLLPPWWTGWVGDDALLLGGHLLMVPAMALVALRHRHPVAAPPRRHPVAAAVARRWPVGLALLMTADLWFAPTVFSPWTLLVLPGGYLVLGAWRRRFGDRRQLAVQLVGLAVWGGLAAVALAAPAGVAGTLVGLGWLGHAGWDLWHHRADGVVPRGYAQWCIALDVAVGVTTLLAVTSG
ncbi:hypothetical protein O7600_05215 [Micromonospora sp. WMMA1998]|uniref:hypothetical protein n=1 Tax=Micromonospora sp. WMMA1998 TaxID=3015167 RepID=UPI00248C0575|nr:hypothetical protein [Micromonospora sp. WMMA1998]WBC16244.1 hypothetical protein O7600_05215 [Micromonospora sp. WMMA1998]